MLLVLWFHICIIVVVVDIIVVFKSITFATNRRMKCCKNSYTFTSYCWSYCCYCCCFWFNSVNKCYVPVSFILLVTLNSTCDVFTLIHWMDDWMNEWAMQMMFITLKFWKSQTFTQVNTYKQIFIIIWIKSKDIFKRMKFCTISISRKFI